ncbi:MAG: 2Fe-2S iron-sulfur cluster binding domain-containing protein [Xanthomonadales bacterium]|nr:2Fe-2S iron-sulfur cluster binding domain-containing protein [Xanthomonadales bacterium]
MPSVTIIEYSGKEHVLDAEVGLTLMECAVDNMVPGIEAECGGCCSCATCHCFVDEQWIERIGRAAGLEAGLLAGTSDPRENSRLCCQIAITDSLDGLIVRLPQSQY